MNPDLLRNYERELSFIRKLGGQFADAYPKIARRLQIGSHGGSEDPHVERLIQAFAFLNARTRQKLDDEFPEITESLLSVLYPHYLAPIPPMGIVELGLNPEQADQPAGYAVPAGTALETDPIDGEPCRFRTCYPVRLFPLAIEEASLSRPPYSVPDTPGVNQAAAVLRIVVRYQGSGESLRALDLKRLRLYLHGQPSQVNLLYELLFNHTREVALANAPRDPHPAVLDPANCLEPVGFTRPEGMLPYPARSFVGYRLLTEFFVFPQKFLFVDLVLEGRIPSQVTNRLELYFYLGRATPDLESSIKAGTFRLGCTPIINLFKQVADPITLTHTDYEYHVVPDERRKLALEVYSVDRVTVTTDGNEEVVYNPFFSVKHGADNQGETYWHASRRQAERNEGEPDEGTEVYLSLVNLNLQPVRAGGGTVAVETTCMNRDLVRRLPFGGDEPRLRVGGAAGGLITRIRSLVPFTAPLRLTQRQGALWRLISHLSLNHLSLVNNEESDSAEALREILKLYDMEDSPRTRKMIEGVRKIEGRRAVGRVGGTTFCRGVEVKIHFDETAYSGNDLFLLASVLERFLALYGTMNSFTTLIALVKDGKGELHRWPPRVGEKVLI